jgi:hypothetical protein
LHPDFYYSKFAPFALQCLEESRSALTKKCGRSAAGHRKDQLLRAGIGCLHVGGERRRQCALDLLQDGMLVAMAIEPAGERRFGTQYQSHRAHVD